MFQKYKDALALMDAAIAAKDAVIAAHGEFETWYRAPDSLAKREPVNKAWDALFTHLHTNFIAPASTYNGKRSAEEEAAFESEVDEMVTMFGKDRAALEEELPKIPPVIAEVAFPVYVARYLLWIQRLPVSPDELTTFTEFHQRYGYMIIKGSDKRRK